MPRPTVLIAAGLGLLGGLAFLGRPARIQSAVITRVADDPTPSAELALTYTRGRRPDAVIVDIRSGNASGSLTADGDEDRITIPLSGALDDLPSIHLLASSRIGGRLWERSYFFTGRVPIPA
ncbi:hypothetical protein F8S13_26865 [Chloroflexia bacterium SDU3-3]|nr:hypothetical protein F8S13_26865 [Chloroflexia bacterium SDU3-3]